MSSQQRYERVAARDADEENEARHIGSSYSSSNQRQPAPIPTSPPPSFRSRTSSPRGRTSEERDPLVSDADRTLADTFDSPSDDESDDESKTGLDDRQRVMSGRPSGREVSTATTEDGRPVVERTVTQLPIFAPATAGAKRVYGGGRSVNDGVFANLSAKPERGDEVEEKPPTYEQAAADATPPYWENTILAPGGASSDEVFIDGLPVGSLFSFVWNGMISMSFQLVGFLLTYLLHTTHAAKNGSKAGLGITLVQYGFTMRTGSSTDKGGSSPGDQFAPPNDPNSHDFDPNAPVGSSDSNSGFVADSQEGSGVVAGLHANDWFAYALMIAGWFILIRAIGQYVKARRHEQLVLQSPSRGLNVAIVAEGEQPEGAV